jgi:hypothetical protein
MKHSNSDNAFGGTFAFLPTHKANPKNAKEPPSHRTTSRKDSANLIQQSFVDGEARTANTGLAKVAVQCSADTFVVNQSLVLRINICGENRHLRQARKRYRQAYWTTQQPLN